MVDIQKGNCLATRGGAPEGKVGDIDAVFAHGLTQCADDARHVFVGGIQHMRTNLGIDIDALDLDEPRLAVAEHCACNRAFPVGCDHGDFDIALKSTGLILTCGADFDAAIFGNYRSADHIDVGVGPFHDPCHRRAIQALRGSFQTQSRHTGC